MPEQIPPATPQPQEPAAAAAQAQAGAQANGQTNGQGNGQSGALALLRRRRKPLALGLALALAVGLGFWWRAKGRVDTDDAQIDGHIYTISPRVPGYVVEVLVTDNELVEKDQPLVRLDRVDYEVALADAISALTTTEEDTSSAGQDVQSASSEYNLAMLEYTRNNELLRSHSVSQSVVDQARSKAETARAKLLSAQAKLSAFTGTRPGGARATKIEAMKAKVKQAALNLEYTTILSPARGHVTRKAVEVGYMVTKGQPLMSVVPLDPGEVWITANFKETQLSGVTPGQKVTFEVDTYPGRTFHGHVDSVMAGTGATFSLFPPENAAGNYVKVVQRVPVKISIDPPEAQDTDARDLPLRVGMSVLPVIHLR